MSLAILPKLLIVGAQREGERVSAGAQRGGERVCLQEHKEEVRQSQLDPVHNL